MAKKRIIYLHGFASGPGSSKAKYFAENCQSLGLQLVIPDLNLPSFESMTLSSQLAIVDDEIMNAAENEERVILVGSSMGGLISVLSSLRHKTVERLILMAPAFAVQDRWKGLWGAEKLEEWKKGSPLNVYHFGYQRDMQFRSQFIDDLSNHQTDDFRVEIPTLLFHGADDEVVPVELSIKFAEANSSVELHVLDDDHQLLTSLPTIWKRACSFLS